MKKLLCVILGVCCILLGGCFPKGELDFARHTVDKSMDLANNAVNQSMNVANEYRGSRTQLNEYETDDE